MKKVFALFVCLAVCCAVTAQQEIPRFFDADAGGQISSAVFSPDGRTIAVAQGGVILFYDAANGRELRRLPKQDTGVAPYLKFVYSPNGRQIAVYYWYGNTIKIWNVETGGLERSITWPDSDTNPLVYSPDGSRIAARSGDIIRIWNTATGGEVRTLPASEIYNMGGSRIMYHPDGRRLLAASAYGISIYNTDTGQALINIAADEESGFGDVLYSPDGKRIAALYGPRNSRAIKIFDAETGRELRVVTVNGNFSNVVYSPDGKTLLTRYRDSNRNYVVKILDAETGRELRTLPVPDYQFAYSLDGRRIVSIPSDAYGEDGKLLFAGSWATVWDTANGRKLLTVGYGPLNAGARAYADLQVARFLGDTAAAGRHEAILQFITGRGNVSRAEIEAYYRQNIGSLIAGVVDAEFKDIAIAANTTTAIKQAISGFFLAPNQTNYNGLKRYKYQDGKPYDEGEIARAEARAEVNLQQVETYEKYGMTQTAESMRESAETLSRFAAGAKAANAYIYTLRALHPALADKVLRESR
ncbi:MAG: WD40 repeat domain-containing protein [Spirochaetaceae bacterium]|nr:WD40 repeat domain-containing protein [Spirochaetaceae bacterium]